MHEILIHIQKAEGFEDLPLPQKQTAGAAGFDLFAAVEQPVTLAPGSVRLIPAGFRMSIPEGYEAQVRPRSGLALKHGIGVLNSPGTIDPDYRGVVSVVLFNFGKEPFTIKRGDRIAQMVFSRTIPVRFSEVLVLDESRRGANGFGSTG